MVISQHICQLRPVGQHCRQYEPQTPLFSKTRGQVPDLLSVLFCEVSRPGQEAIRPNARSMVGGSLSRPDFCGDRESGFAVPRTSYDLHADRQTFRRLAHRNGPRPACRNAGSPGGLTASAPPHRCLTCARCSTRSNVSALRNEVCNRTTACPRLPNPENTCFGRAFRSRQSPSTPGHAC